MKTPTTKQLQAHWEKALRRHLQEIRDEAMEASAMLELSGAIDDESPAKLHEFLQAVIRGAETAMTNSIGELDHHRWYSDEGVIFHPDLPNGWEIRRRENMLDGEGNIEAWATKQYHVLDGRTDARGQGDTIEEAMRDAGLPR